MPIPKNKQELIEFSEEKYRVLIEKVRTLPKKEIVKPRWNGRSIKDNLAHVHAWQTMMELWYDQGMKKIPYHMPAPGYSWRDGPKLNSEIDKKYKKTPLKKVIADLSKTNKTMIALIKKHSDKELFTKKLYSWTGSSSLAVYLRLSAYSHYDWALKKLKKL